MKQIGLRTRGVAAGAIAMLALLGLPLSHQKVSLALPQKADRTCGDFAAAWAEKPPEMRFLGCEKISAAPGEGLRATYLVNGFDAAGVEEFLRQEFGLPSLVFICCGWTTSGPQQAQYYIRETETYVSISMHSEEAVGTSSGEFAIAGREDWHQLQFYVYVEKVWGI